MRAFKGFSKTTKHLSQNVTSTASLSHLIPRQRDPDILLTMLCYVIWRFCIAPLTGGYSEALSA